VQDPPEADPEAHHRYITLSDWEGQGERSPSRRSERFEQRMQPILLAAHNEVICKE
jgi:hypothetical protein